MKMLIVDDEETVVDFFSTAAQKRGHTDVDTAFSGEQALGRVVQNTYDLITLDIRMPGVTGLEIISPLRSMCPHAIIAIISGHLLEETIPDLAGCADVIISKPVDLKTFNRLLDGAERISETMSEVRQLGDGRTVAD